MVRRGRGDRRGDDVAGAHLFIRREMHQSAVACPAGHACHADVLAPFAGGNQQFYGLPDERRDCPPTRSAPAARPAAHSVLAQLLFGSCPSSSAAGVPGRLEYWNVKRGGKSGLSHHVQSRSEVLLGFRRGTRRSGR